MEKNQKRFMNTTFSSLCAVQASDESDTAAGAPSGKDSTVIAAASTDRVSEASVAGLGLVGGEDRRATRIRKRGEIHEVEVSAFRSGFPSAVAGEAGGGDVADADADDPERSQESRCTLSRVPELNTSRGGSPEAVRC